MLNNQNSTSKTILKCYKKKGDRGEFKDGFFTPSLKKLFVTTDVYGLFAALLLDFLIRETHVCRYLLHSTNLQIKFNSNNLLRVLKHSSIRYYLTEFHLLGCIIRTYMFECGHRKGFGSADFDTIYTIYLFLCT